MSNLARIQSMLSTGQKKNIGPVFFDLGQSMLSTVIFEHMSNLARIQSTLSTGQKKNIVPFFRLGPINAINGHFRTYVQSGQNPVNAVNGSKKKHSPVSFGYNMISSIICLEPSQC